jgi:hypothetical protein
MLTIVAGVATWEREVILAPRPLRRAAPSVSQRCCHDARLVAGHHHRGTPAHHPPATDDLAIFSAVISVGILALAQGTTGTIDASAHPVAVGGRDVRFRETERAVKRPESGARHCRSRAWAWPVYGNRPCANPRGTGGTVWGIDDSGTPVQVAGRLRSFADWRPRGEGDIAIFGPTASISYLVFRS